MLIEIIESVIIVISVSINYFLCKVLFEKNKKLDLYKTWIEDGDLWVNGVQDIIRATYIKMKSIDDRNLFYKDDDVGFVFSELLSLVKTLNDRIQP